MGSCTDSIFHVAPSMYIRENLEGLRVIFHLRQWIRGSGTRWGKNVITRIEYMHAHTTFAKKQMYRNILLKIWTCTTTTLCDQQSNHFIFIFLLIIWTYPLLWQWKWNRDVALHALVNLLDYTQNFFFLKQGEESSCVAWFCCLSCIKLITSHI